VLPAPSPYLHNCSYVCANHCVQLLYTTQHRKHRTVLIIFTFILQTIIVAQTMSTEWKVEQQCRRYTPCSRRMMRTTRCSFISMSSFVPRYQSRYVSTVLRTSRRAINIACMHHRGASNMCSAASRTTPRLQQPSIFRDDGISIFHSKSQFLLPLCAFGALTLLVGRQEDHMAC